MDGQHSIFWEDLRCSLQTWDYRSKHLLALTLAPAFKMQNTSWVWLNLFLTQWHWMQSVVIQCFFYLLYSSCAMLRKALNICGFWAVCVSRSSSYLTCVLSNEICLKIRIFGHLFEAWNKPKFKILSAGKLLFVVDNRCLLLCIIRILYRKSNWGSFVKSRINLIVCFRQLRGNDMQLPWAQIIKEKEFGLYCLISLIKCFSI